MTATTILNFFAQTREMSNHHLILHAYLVDMCTEVINALCVEQCVDWYTCALFYTFDSRCLRYPSREMSELVRSWILTSCQPNRGSTQYEQGNNITKGKRYHGRETLPHKGNDTTNGERYCKRETVSQKGNGTTEGKRHHKKGTILQKGNDITKGKRSTTHPPTPKKEAWMRRYYNRDTIVWIHSRWPDL